jgi:hypothetical protein
VVLDLAWDVIKDVATWACAAHKAARTKAEHRLGLLRPYPLRSRVRRRPGEKSSNPSMAEALLLWGRRKCGQ